MLIADIKLLLSPIVGLQNMLMINWSGLLRRYSPDFLENQQMTLCDVVQRAVKKGRGGEVIIFQFICQHLNPNNPTFLLLAKNNAYYWH